MLFVVVNSSFVPPNLGYLKRPVDTENLERSIFSRASPGAEKEHCEHMVSELRLKFRETEALATASNG